jgi:hypothetical protein
MGLAILIISIKYFILGISPKLAINKISDRLKLTWGILIAALFYVAAIIPTWVADVQGAPPGNR